MFKTLIVILLTVLATLVPVRYFLAASGPKAPMLWDVTVFIPGEGVKTVVITADDFKVEGGCFQTTTPKRYVACNVLQVVKCTERCTEAAAPQPVPPAPAGFDPLSRIAER